VNRKDFFSIPELAKILGVSRIAVYKKVKAGIIKAVRVGKTFGIPKESLPAILGKVLKEKNKKEIDRAVKRTVKEYGEVLKKLGQE
jgi:excisionase family DNA binding protein